MSSNQKAVQSLLDCLARDPRYSEGGWIDINRLDDLDPVHLRDARVDQTDYDWHGEQHQEVAANPMGDWKQIGEVLPVIAAPSIVPGAAGDEARRAEGARHQGEIAEGET